MATPPEVEDVQAALVEERARVAALYKELDARDRQIARMRYRGSEDAELLKLKTEIIGLHASASWRITKPLRKMKAAWLAWRRGLPASMPGPHVGALPGVPDVASTPATPPSRHPRILIVDLRIPVPDIQSSGVRMAAIVAIVLDLGFEVTLVSDHAPSDYHWIFDNVGEQLRARTAKLESQGVSVVFGYDAAVAQLATVGESYDFAYVCLPDLMLRYAPAIRLHAPQVTLVYDTVDLHGLRYRRAAELGGDAEEFRRAEYYERLEAANIPAADRVVAISSTEAAQILQRHPASQVFTIPNIHGARESVPGFAKRAGLLFIGHYLHAPNEDAALHLTREILPIVRKSLGAAPLYIVGSAPSRTIRDLSGPGVHVIGPVEDPIQYFDMCRVFAAPLRFGAGMKGKIGQSMSLGLPVVTTNVGAEGMHLENGLTCLIADEPKEFAAAIVRLYRDESLWNALSLSALEHVKTHFSHAIARQALQSLFQTSRDTKFSRGAA